MKKILWLLIIVLISGGGIYYYQVKKQNNNQDTSLWEETVDSLAFKEEYEAVNNEVYSNGTPYIKLELPTKNPFVYLDYDQTISLIEGGTGILFFSRPGCPYCRSTLLATIEFARQNNIKEIYYYNPEEIRAANNDEYKLLLELLDEHLPIDRVTQKEEDATFNPELKRLVVPHVFFIYNGEVISHYQEGRAEFREELTLEQAQEIINIYKLGYDQLKDAMAVCSPSSPDEC
jgi:thiol-disulfide isomerase/thioredoxin